MTTANRRNTTAEELWRMPADGMRHEVVAGDVTTMAPAGFEHGVIIIRLARLLANHVEANRLGVVLGAETGFLLARNPDTVRAADVAFVSQARISTPLPRQFWIGAPDLAAEVLSPSDTAEEVEEKVNNYLDAGCKLVWVLNPRRRTVTAYRQGINPVIASNDELLEGLDIVLGFRCRVAELFV